MRLWLSRSLLPQVQRSCQLVHRGSRFGSQQEVGSSDKWQKSRGKLLSVLVNVQKKSDPERLRSVFFSLKLVSMVQAIKDLANAFVPSGRLIELVDISLVCCFFFFFPLSLCFVVLKGLKASVHSVLFFLQPLMADTLPQPFGEEIKGIAAVSGVPLGNKTHFFSSQGCVCF